MNLPLFRGTGVALVTPFKDDNVDFDQLETLIDFQIENGVDFLVMLGSTGEAITLSEMEARQILDCTIQKVNNRVPIIAGNFGSSNTANLVAKIKNYNFDGITAIMSSVPSYNKPTQEGIYAHFMAIEKVSPIPIIIYNVPSRTASNINAKTTIRLANASPKFIAIKEASNKSSQICQIIKSRPENFSVLSGDDLFSLPIISYGGDGVISVIANAFPSFFSKMIKAALNGDFKTAANINLLLLDIHPSLYVDGNPAGIKAAMEILELCHHSVRLPLTPATDECRQNLTIEINAVLKKMIQTA